MAYVYAHIRSDTNEVFYIGIGKTVARAKSAGSRNRHWKFIVSKVECSFKLLHSNVDWRLACELEKHYIKKHGRRDLGTGTLVNMTEGGDGVYGLKHSESFKKKISRVQKGRIKSDIERKNISIRMSTRIVSKETRSAMSESAKKRGVPWRLKPVVNLLTGKVFKSVKEASMYSRIPTSTLASKLRGAKQNDTSYVYL